MKRGIGQRPLQTATTKLGVARLCYEYAQGLLQNKRIAATLSDFNRPENSGLLPFREVATNFKQLYRVVPDLKGNIF